MNVLVIAAHPDDEVLGVGGTIAWHAKIKNDNVYTFIATEGCSAKYEYKPEMIDIRYKSALKANEHLGVKDVILANLPDMKLEKYGHVELNIHIEKAIEKIKPSVIYTHHPDINIDHQLVFESTLVATRPVPSSCVKKVLTYPTISATEWMAPFIDKHFIPNVFVNIEETIEDKIEAFKFYEMELRDFPHPRHPDSIRIYAQKNGINVGYKAAECFMLIRELY